MILMLLFKKEWNILIIVSQLISVYDDTDASI